MRECVLGNTTKMAALENLQNQSWVFSNLDIGSAMRV